MSIPEPDPPTTGEIVSQLPPAASEVPAESDDDVEALSGQNGEEDEEVAPADLTATKALDELDRTWYYPSRPRWMDSIGDFAGQELFVIDGDALLSTVLDNSLLALGRKDDPSFQLLHATWLLEKTIKDFVDRDCTFEIAFFDCNYHSTVKTGQADSVTASRGLARSILSRQAHLSGVTVHSFESLEDDAWLSFSHRRRPYCIFTSDGGLRRTNEELEPERILVQRSFTHQAVQQRIPIVLLPPAEFKDGKIMSYVFGVRYRASNFRPQLDGAIEDAREALEQAAPTPPDVFSSPSSSSTVDLVSHAAATFLSGVTEEAAKEKAQALLYVYLAHVIVLPSLPLASRAQVLPSTPSELLSYLQGTFLPSLYKALTASVDALPEEDTLSDIDLDGRTFLLLLYDILRSDADSLEASLGPEVTAVLAEKWSTLSLPVPSLSTLRSAFPTAPAMVPAAEPQPPSTLLPFSNPIFDPLLPTPSVSPASTPSSIPTTVTENASFSDTLPYLAPKPVLPTHLGGAPPVQLTPRERKKRDRKDQRYMSQMQKSAASLTGAMGGVLRQQAIPAVGKAAKARGGALKEKAAHAGQAQSGGKKVLTSKEKLLAENLAKKQAEELVENTKWWTERLTTLKPLNPVQQSSLLDAYLKNKRSSDAWLGTEIALKRIDVELRRWIADVPGQTHKELRDEFRVRVAVRCQEVLRKFERGEAKINEKQGKALTGTLEALGLGCLLPKDIVFGEKADTSSSGGKGAKGDKKEKEKKLKPGQGKKESKDAVAAAKSSKSGDKKKDEDEGEEKVKLTFSFVSLSKSGKLLYEFMGLDGEDPLEFQLRSMGEFMVRSLDSKPDPRVDFEPDKWQRDVLDKIDNDESMLIVAPTSSGKTFISFAAMEKVLRESDDGVVVYVAPTKALVNQVAAEVFARYKKDVPGANMWAIHTRDYRINNPQNCQVLVTVPHILSLMLLSPQLAKVWVPRLKRVILDEIHSISAEEGGAIWEQVLLMNPAPIIGLSATVGAPERFSDWLAQVEANRGRKYSLIQHHHRFNALRKFVYAPKLPLKNVGRLDEHERKHDVFAAIHPISALALGDPNLPDDLALEPRDTLSLYKAMAASGEVEARLAPATYFGNHPAIAIRDVIEYETELKTAFVQWMKEPNANEPDSPYRKVVQLLEGPLRATVQPSEQQIEEDGDEAFYSLFLPLLADLNAQGSLPAILFNFDRIQCERIAARLLSDLEAAEGKWRSKSPEFKRKVAKAKEDEKLARAKAKATESANKNKKDEDGDRVEEEGPSTFNPDDPSEEFSFVGKGISHVEFAKELSDLAWLKLDPWLINALRRGVGVHHSGLNRRYRTLVENLYRRGVLRVVISTQTLALGVNAPARTCVFAGDSIDLSPLQYRQAAGRAGRRGFDTLGLVVFVGVTLDRIQRLFLSRLPKLGGTFPLSATLVLRLHNLLHGSDNAPLPKEAIESLLSLDQLSVGNHSGQAQTKYFVRSMIEYLRRIGLLDEDGQPMNLYGLASTLYPFEPSNFALIALLRSGELHNITRKFDENPDNVLRQLIVVLANLFSREMRRAQSPESLSLAGRNSTSLVILPNQPRAIANVLTRHNQAVVSIFSTYAQDYARQHAEELGEDITLPLSDRKIGTSSLADGTFAANLRQTALDVDSRSPFVAISGHGDSYASVAELSDTCRTGLILATHALPVLPFTTSQDHQLDAYILDFYRSGSLETVIRENGIPRGEVWFSLQVFDQAVTQIKTSLEMLLQRSTEEKEEDNDSDAGQDDLEAEGNEEQIPRPPNVSDADWALYRAINALQVDFRAKFFKIFA